MVADLSNGGVVRNVCSQRYTQGDTKVTGGEIYKSYLELTIDCEEGNS